MKDVERLKILTDTLIKLAELWMKVTPGAACHSVHASLDFIKRKITEELKK